MYNGWLDIMKVALDGTPLSTSRGGIARYTAELLRALAAEFPEDEYWLLSDQPVRHLDAGGLARTDARLRSGWERRWWSLGLPGTISRRGIDLFHGTDFAVPYAPLRPSVMTIHDLSPWKDTAWNEASARVRRRTPRLVELGLATMVVTPTESVRREVLGAFRIHPDRVAAVPHAASPCFRPVPAAGPSRPYFLYVGALEPRKNLGVAAEAWARLRRTREAGLVLAGKPRTGYRLPPAAEGATLAGELSDEHLPALYSGAVALLCPSFYEGFGLPVLEAMSCGAAVFVSLDPALGEVAGDAGVRLDGSDPEAWAAAMRTALVNREWLESCRERSLRRSRDFSWPRTARRTREVYLEARARFGR